MLEPAIAAALRRSRTTIAITGAGGWLGMATLDLLERALGDRFSARVRAFGSSARMLDLGGGRRVAQRPLAALGEIEAPDVWVLHFAFQTKDRAETLDEQAYRAANLAIARSVLASLDRIDARALFVASSGAATRADDPGSGSAMRLYGAMKRDDEERFAAWGTARGARVAIGRIYSLTGPYINKHGAYAIASFILDALAARPIVVTASHEVVRGYVAIRELASLVFALLSDKPEGTVRFDSGGEPLELGAVAQTVADALGGGPPVRAPITHPATDRYAGDAAAYAGLLARHAIVSVPLAAQVVETARWLAAQAGAVPRAGPPA